MSGKNVESELESLNQSAQKVQGLRKQLIAAEKEHTVLVSKALEAAEKNPSRWKYGFQTPNGDHMEVRMTRELLALVRTLSMRTAGSGGEVQCPPKPGCAVIGNQSGICQYLCQVADSQSFD